MVSVTFTNLIDDTSPQLGGDLDLNGNVITGLEPGTDILANIVEDATPQLGGNLDLNGNVITGLEIGTDVQAFDATLASLAAVVGVAGDILVASGADAWARLATVTNGTVLGRLSVVPAWASAGGQLFRV